MSCVDASNRLVRCIVIVPNQPYEWTVVARWYGALFVASLVVAIVLAALGYWPILVFAALEWLAIGGCAWALLRATRYRETITMTDERVIVAQGHSGAGCVADYQRYWATIDLQQGRSWYPSRLLIKAREQQIEVGRSLTEDEREVLKQRLKRLIGTMAQSPNLV